MFIKKQEKEKINEQIATLKHELAELKEIVKTQELQKLRVENQKMKEKLQLLSNVHLHVKSYAYDPENNQFIVRYEVPALALDFNSDGELVRNEMFYSINALRLIPMDEMEGMQKALQRAKASQPKISDK